MKDIEKIKSEDLAAQVQDANPANFAIEQEVAQLVGATVPAPTEPSADDARELGAQLLVFLRRALLPIRSALRTAVAAIYAHLDSRCTDYTPAAYDPFRLPAGPYDPMRPFVPRTLPNLLTAITAFDSRKISNGSAPSDGIPDGISLARLLCADYAAVTEIKDDTPVWKFNGLFSRIRNAFPNATTFTLNCEDIEFTNDMGWTYGITGVRELQLPYLKNMHNHGGSYNGVGFCGAGYERLYLPSFEFYRCDAHGSIFANDQTVKYIDGPKLGYFSPGYSGNVVRNCSELLELNIPAFDWSYNYAPYYCILSSCPKIRKLVIGQCALGLVISGTTDDLIDVTIKDGYSISLPMGTWNPTNALSSSASDLVADPTAHPTWKNLDQFLQNFKEHIALRLTANGSGLTLTLSQAVFDTIWNADGTPKSTDPDSVIYQINKIIKTDKHWSVNRA